MVSLPGIPPVAVSYLRAAAIAAMNDRVEIVRPSAPVYDPATRRAVGATRQAGYSGPAHVHSATGGGEQVVADGLEEINSLTVSIPLDASPMPLIEDHIVLTSSVDPALAGETLRIIGISAGGTLAAVRLLTCTFVQGNPWNPSA